jgi:protease II
VLKEIIDRIPQREVSAPYSKNGYRYRQVYEPGCEYAIYQRQSVLKEEWDEWESCLMQPARGAERILYPRRAGHFARQQLMAVAEDYLSRRQYGLRFCNLQTANGIRKCWKTSRRILPGAMIRRRCGTCVNIPPRCCLIRSGATPWAPPQFRCAGLRGEG